MLNNFERYQRGNVGRVDEVQQHIADASSNGQGDTGNQPADDTAFVRPTKQPCSLSSDDENDKYEKRTHLDFDLLPWNKTEDPGHDTSLKLSLSLQKTHTLLENFSRDVKRAHSSLLNCNRSIPQFPQVSGSTCLAKTQSTSTMSSPIFTPSPIAPGTLSNLGKTWNYSMGHLHWPKPSKHMETGSSPGIAWSMPCSLCLNTENMNYRPTANISKDILPLYQPSCIVESSTTTGPAELELPSDEISSFPISQNSQTCRSNGLITHQILPQVRLLNRSQSRVEIVDEVPPVEDGMRIDAPNSAANCNYLHVCSKCSNTGHVASDCGSSNKK